MRKTIIAGNWKMYKTVPEAIALVESLKKLVAGVTQTEIVVCPSYIALTEVAKVIKETNISLGAQNVYFEDEGAFTGEVSLSMLKSAGVSYVIITLKDKNKPVIRSFNIKEGKIAEEEVRIE